MFAGNVVPWKYLLRLAWGVSFGVKDLRHFSIIIYHRVIVVTIILDFYTFLGTVT